MVHLYVTGNTNALDVMLEEIQIKQILRWTEFTSAVQKNDIYNDSIQEYIDLLNMSEINVKSCIQIKSKAQFWI